LDGAFLPPICLTYSHSRIHDVYYVACWSRWLLWVNGSFWPKI
jgi:hypothetical protein